ncbi:MAG: aminotransferase class V-fold PLP-dependent enzyme [Gemmatimonadaceae bacterium]
MLATVLDALHPTSATDDADDAWFSAWRARELARVVKSGVTYVDYTGAALYPESVVREDCRRLEQAVLGNPHSEHLPSLASTADAVQARRAILDFLHADPAEYACVLTSNASHACRLVGESFPFGPGSHLTLTADNHNSVNGIREYARRRGACVERIGLTSELRLADASGRLNRQIDKPSLLAFPAQSNFSGVRHPLALVSHARDHGWFVLLDAASYLPTADLDLRAYSPDFVALSLYKIIGYPGGIGALVARHEALERLQRPSFAGGTVHWVSVQHNAHRLLQGPAGFEDGTLPFTTLGAVAPALAAARAADRERLSRHLHALTHALLAGCTALQHRHGAPVVRIHGPADTTNRGATVALTLMQADGTAVPFWEGEASAREAGIAVRGGCFCNPGCAEEAFAFAPAATAACLDALGTDFSIPRFAACLGRGPVGAIRVSLGLGSIQSDVDRVLAWLSTFVH